MSVYEGKENYIFISYSHKDNAVVLPLIEAIQKAGFRVWFDEGIEPGSEWPEYIETHLMGSACVLAFISPSSVESPFCRKEIGLAISHNDSNDKDKKHIDFLSVYLEETELKYGLGLLIGNSQSLFRYNYNSDAEFLTEILTAPKLQSCKIGSHLDTSVAKDVKLPSRSGSTDDNPLLKRAFMFLEDKDYANANVYFEKVLDSDPENANAYLGKLLIDFQLTQTFELFWIYDKLAENANFKKFMRFGDDSTKLSIVNRAFDVIAKIALGTNEMKKYDSISFVSDALCNSKNFFDLMTGKKNAHLESADFAEFVSATTVIIADTMLDHVRDYIAIKNFFSRLPNLPKIQNAISAWAIVKANDLMLNKSYADFFIVCSELIPFIENNASVVCRLVFTALVNSERNINYQISHKFTALEIWLKYKFADDDIGIYILGLLKRHEIPSADMILDCINYLANCGIGEDALGALIFDNAKAITNLKDKFKLLSRIPYIEEAAIMAKQVRLELLEEEKIRQEEEEKARIAAEKKRAQEAKKRAEEKARKEQEKKERLEAERKAAELRDKIAHVKFLFPLLLASLFGIIMSVLTSYDMLDYELTHPWIFCFIISFAVMSITSAFAGPFRKLGITITGISGVIQLLGWYNFNHVWIEGDNKEWQYFYEDFNPSFIAALIAAAICLIIYFIILKKKKR